MLTRARPGRGPRFSMYCTTPSGTRYQTGMPRATRSRQSVELIASAGTSTRLTAPSGRWWSARWYPGRVTPMKWASSNSRSLSRQPTICSSASAPVMKNSSASGRCALQVGERVDRVGRAAAVDVDPADGEPRVGRGRDDRHQVAVLGRADLALATSATADRWGRTRPRPARTGRRPRWRRRGGRGGWDRTSRPSRRCACLPPQRA